MFGIFFKCMGFFFFKRNDQGTFSQKISMYLYILIFLWCSDCNAGIGMGFYEETFFENLRHQIFLAYLRQPIMKKWVASAHPVPILMFRQNHIPKYYLLHATTFSPDSRPHKCSATNWVFFSDLIPGHFLGNRRKYVVRRPDSLVLLLLLYAWLTYLPCN